MNKTNLRLQELFNRYAARLAAEDEKQELWDYVNDPLFDAQLKALIGADYEREHTEPGLTEEQKAVVLLNVLKAEPTQADVKKRSVKFNNWPFIAAAASILILISVGLWFYNTRHPQGSLATKDLFANDIAPGKNTATLTLANGKTIILSDAKSGVVVGGDLRYNDGSLVRNSSGTHEVLTASTPRGGTYQVTLPDGSKVWLNAATSIKFPSTFKGLVNRKVELIGGEAYFEVAKNKAQPFVVESNGQMVEVLGTHFNINSYADEGSIKTTLLEGSVKVNNMVLKPNQQSVLSSNKINIRSVDAQSEIAWKNGDFNFNNESIQDIMKQLSRWYDIEIKYEGEITQDMYYAKISRNRNISEVLKRLEEAKGVHFKIEGRKVIVTK